MRARARPDSYHRGGNKVVLRSFVVFVSSVLLFDLLSPWHALDVQLRRVEIIRGRRAAARLCARNEKTVPLPRQINRMEIMKSTGVGRSITKVYVLFICYFLSLLYFFSFYSFFLTCQLLLCKFYFFCACIQINWLSHISYCNAWEKNIPRRVVINTSFIHPFIYYMVGLLHGTPISRFISAFASGG